jgi:hypothetical protein
MTDRPITTPTESAPPRLTFRGATGALYEVIEEHDVIGIDVLRGTGCGCTVHGDRPTGLLRFPMTEEGPSAA